MNIATWNDSSDPDFVACINTDSRVLNIENTTFMQSAPREQKYDWVSRFVLNRYPSAIFYLDSSMDYGFESRLDRSKYPLMNMFSDNVDIRYTKYIDTWNMEWLKTFYIIKEMIYWNHLTLNILNGDHEKMSILRNWLCANDHQSQVRWDANGWNWNHQKFIISPFSGKEMSVEMRSPLFDYFKATIGCINLALRNGMLSS